MLVRVSGPQTLAFARTIQTDRGGACCGEIWTDPCTGRNIRPQPHGGRARSWFFAPRSRLWPRPLASWFGAWHLESAGGRRAISERQAMSNEVQFRLYA